ncbi:MAG: amidophosphoribosyltransferase [Bacillota bacterium]|nr:amidophosphoribosyltransferase [Bacillota bacterium]
MNKNFRGILGTEKLHEECGIFGISVSEKDSFNPAHEAYTALFALQHRGQEACGIAVNDKGVISLQKNVGLVPEVFDDDDLISLPGQSAIGHVRYSTLGKNTRENAQPIVISHIKGNLAIAHNGALTNAYELREKYEMAGGIFHTSNDSEVIAYAIVRERLKTDSIEDAVKNAMGKIKGAYSLVIMSPRKLIAVRDPSGFRPLCIGKLSNSYVFASESCALDAIGATFLRDVEPGEIVVCLEGELTSIESGIKAKEGLCVFEYVYFARPDSVIDGLSVDAARREMGKYLARTYPVDADLVFGVPDSGLSAALGYAEESGVPYGTGLIKNRYIGRTFIQPSQTQRERAVSIKLNVLSSAVRGKRVVMVDDSIVRGTTSANIVRMIREVGALEVHMRLSSPPFKNPCYFGTDVPDRDMLIAHKMSVEEIGKKIGVDSIGFLPVEAFEKIEKGCGRRFCLGCFSGKYPVKEPDVSRKNIFERRIGE